MYEKLKTLLAEQLRIDESKISRDSLIKEDLGADSLDVLQLLMTLEDDYGIKIPDEKLANFRTVADIADFLDALKK